MALDEPHQAPPTTPEGLRRRYLALKRQAQEYRASGPAALDAQPNPRELAPEQIVHAETIPAGWYWTRLLKRGETLRLIDVSGTPGLSAMFWNADDPSERYNAGDTVKIQWNANPTKGRVLFSDMGRVLMSITDDSCGAHDTLLGGGSLGPRNTQDNFLLAAAKHGLGRRDVPPCITFFAAVATDEAGGFRWRASKVRPGVHVDLRAEMNVLAALSNCPHPLAPPELPAGPVQAVVWRSPPATAADLCRNASEEAVRGFQNTDALFTD